MNFLKNLIDKKDRKIMSNSDFWNWFKKHEKTFFKSVKNGKNIEKYFFYHLSQKLTELKDGYFYVTGMVDEDTAELIFTPDGVVKNVVFVEELVHSAPEINGWKFTALKPPLDIKDVSIRMDGYVFSKDNLLFYSNNNLEHSDAVDITITYKDYKEDDKNTIINGIYIFLDNYLGEENFITTIDKLTVTGHNKETEEIIPIKKLRDFLIWRQKEFLEVYDEKRYINKNDNYLSLESELENGKPVIAIVNSTLLKWDSKFSHPWIMNIQIQYVSDKDNGMPDDNTYELMNNFEDEIMNELKDSDGFLNIGRETSDNSRLVYFACKDFRKSSKVIYQLINKYAHVLKITYDIYKDKYWESLNRYKLS